jgi:hypothetical protein
VGKCLDDLGGVRQVHALDKHGYILFNPFELDFYGYLLHGRPCCSNSSLISAHYVSQDEMMRIDLVMKLMQDEYERGEISKPSYLDIYTRVVYMRTFLNANYPIYPYY